MKRILLLTVALLGASHFLRDSDADGGHRRPRGRDATRTAVIVGDDDVFRTASAVTGDDLPLPPPIPPEPPAPPSPPALLVEHEGEDCAEECDEADACDEPIDWFPAGERPFVPPAATRGPAVVVGDLSATPEKAEEYARDKLEQALTGWLVPEVPPSWKAPETLVDRVIRDGRSRESTLKVKGEPLTVHQAALLVDLSSSRRAEFLRVYEKSEGLKKMGWLGVGLAFVLACLAILTGYIRTDEATKGYYTSRLRMVATAGVGAAAVAAYQFLG